jgi:hypothetical protein
MESKQGPAGEVVRAHRLAREMDAARRMLRSGSTEGDQAVRAAAEAIRVDLSGERGEPGAYAFPRRPRD